jgi:hypothetical protein
MAKKTFQLTARVSAENPKAIKPILDEVLPKGSFTKTDEGFIIKTKMVGESARELNKTLLSALRRVVRSVTSCDPGVVTLVTHLCRLNSNNLSTFSCQ